MREEGRKEGYLIPFHSFPFRLYPGDLPFPSLPFPSLPLFPSLRTKVVAVVVVVTCIHPIQIYTVYA